MNGAPLPSSEVLDARLEDQRERIFGVAAMLGLAVIVARDGTDAVEGKLSSITACDLHAVLRQARELLDEVAGALDPAVILDPQPTPQENTRGGDE